MADPLAEVRAEVEQAVGALERSLLANRRAAWLVERRGAITGTDAGKILGVAPPAYGGPMSVYLEKTGELPEAPATPWRESGLRLERPILEWYADTEGAPLAFYAPYTLLRAHNDPRLGVTLDAIRTDEKTPAPVDAKNIRIKGDDWGEPKTDQIPVYYAAQLVMQMRVTGADFADLAVLFSGQDLFAYRLYRDRETEAAVVDRALEFWANHVEKRIPPDVDGSRDWGEYLKRRFRQATELVIPAEVSHHSLARELHEAEMAEDAAKAQTEMLKNRLKLAIGDNKGMTGGSWKATWSQEKDSVGADWEAIARKLSLSLSLVGTTLGTLRLEHVEPAATKAIVDLLAELPSLAALEKEHQKVTRRGARKFHFNYKTQ